MAILHLVRIRIKVVDIGLMGGSLLLFGMLFMKVMIGCLIDQGYVSMSIQMK